MSQSPLWKLSVKQLGSNLAEAVELAQLLREAVPHIRVVDNCPTNQRAAPSSSGSTPRHWSLKERLQKAAACGIGQGCIDWSDLRFVVSSENLRAQDSPFADAQVVEVNTGGRVFFCFLRPTSSSSPLHLAAGAVQAGADDPHVPGGSGGQNAPPDAAYNTTHGREGSCASSLSEAVGAGDQPGPFSTHMGTSAADAQPSAAELQRLASQLAVERYLTSARCADSIDCRSGLLAASSEQGQLPEDGQQRQQPISYPTTPVAGDQPGAQVEPALAQHLPTQPSTTGRPPERVVVLKVAPSRLLAQAEQFANELARYLGIAAPECRIVRQVGATAEEWRQLVGAAGGAGSEGGELGEELRRVPCALLMEFVAGSPLAVAAGEELQGARAGGTAHDLGRLFLLDMLLGNADRLPCAELGWRGNAGNVLFGSSAGAFAGRVVAIDSAVQRRPPAARSSAADERAERLAQLLLHSPDTAVAILQQLLAGHPAAAAASADPACVAAFQHGLRACLGRAIAIQGLLEMVAQVQCDLLAAFLEDLAAWRCRAAGGQAAGAAGGGSTTRRAAAHDGSSAGAAPSSPDSSPDQRGEGSEAAPRSPPVARTVTAGTIEAMRSMTAALREISAGARRDEALGDRVQHWKRVFKDRGEDLKAAMGAWQQRHQLERRLTTGFLDGSHPIVDGYELQVRLDHVLRRLGALRCAAASAAPARVEPGLYLGDAVCADAHHLLRHLGVTHIVNATQDLLLPPPEAGFACVRVPLRDLGTEDIRAQLGVVAQQVAAARAGGGALLVHCHEGRSRSVALVLAYLMRQRGMTLRQALELVRSVRPQASPNSGFMQVLARLDAQLHGRASLQVERSWRPRALGCPECGLLVGVSRLSLQHHLRTKHPGSRAYEK